MTTFLIQPHGTGKTTALIDRLRDGDLDVLVFATGHQKRIAMRLAAERGDSIPDDRFVSVHELIDGTSPTLDPRDAPGGLGTAWRVGIDEVDAVLSALLRGRIDVVTGTTREP